MVPEGMVHALEIIHQLLTPDGLLIDIHPTSVPPPIVVRSAGQDFSVGWLQEKDDFIEYRQAGQAIQQAVEQRWFTVEEAGEFLFSIHADGLLELTAHLAVEWKDAVITPESAAIIESLYREHQDKKEIIITERIHIARYRRVA